MCHPLSLWRSLFFRVFCSRLFPSACPVQANRTYECTPTGCRCCRIYTPRFTSTASVRSPLVLAASRTIPCVVTAKSTSWFWHMGFFFFAGSNTQAAAAHLARGRPAAVSALTLLASLYARARYYAALPWTCWCSWMLIARTMCTNDLSSSEDNAKRAWLCVRAKKKKLRKKFVRKKRTFFHVSISAPPRHAPCARPTGEGQTTPDYCVVLMKRSRGSSPRFSVLYKYFGVMSSCLPPIPDLIHTRVIFGYGAPNIANRAPSRPFRG